MSYRLPLVSSWLLLAWPRWQFQPLGRKPRSCCLSSPTVSYVECCLPPCRYTFFLREGIGSNNQLLSFVHCHRLPSRGLWLVRIRECACNCSLTANAAV